MVNIVGSLGSMISTVTTRFNLCGVKEDTDNTEMNKCSCLPIKLYKQAKLDQQSLLP